jgi:hypothetical protein
MFRRKQTDKPEANRLSNEAEPNKLSWGAADAEPAGDPDLELDEEFDDDLDDELDGEAEDDDPEAIARREAEFEAEIERQAEEFGLATDDPKAIYGPNGDSVAAVLEGLDGMDTETAERLADAWDAVDPSERDVLDRVLQRRHRGGSHQYELSAAEDSVSAWLVAQKPRGDQEAEVARIVAAAARDAVDAFILDEELDDIDYDILSGPWLSVMESEDEAEEGVEGVEAIGTAATDADESADREAEGKGAFGPNSELVADFLEKLKALDIELTDKLVAVWREQPKSDLKAAHRALQALVEEDEAWREQVRLAQEGVFAWMAGSKPATHYTDTRSADDARVRERAGPAVADAIAALVMADILEPEDAETLYAPWEEVVGEPKLPAFEDDTTDSRP